MVDKVIERPSYTPPVAGAETAFVGQLLQTTQQHGYAINQLSGEFEEGVFTPTLDFDTTGDLSNAYTTQDGFFWRIGPIVHFHAYLVVTPTFTTAAGSFRLEGLPYAMAPAGAQHVIHSVRMSATGLTWAYNDLVAFTRDTQDWIEFAFQGSGVAGRNFAASDLASASQVSVFVTGFYPMR